MHIAGIVPAAAICKKEGNFMYRYVKKIIAGLLTAALIFPMTVSLAEPLSVSARELLGETSFDYKMIPWVTAESSPAKQDFEIADGAVHLIILRPDGRDRALWDLKFLHRGLCFQKGKTYRIRFKVKALREGMELMTFIGLPDGRERYFELDGDTGEMHLGPDMGGQWGKCVTLTDEYQEFSGIFKPDRDIEDAVWEFWYANDSNGHGGNAVAGDELWFDDMSVCDWEVLEPSPDENYGQASRRFSGLDQNYISVNQLGYYPELAKYATLGSNEGDVSYGSSGIELTGSYDYEIVSTATEKVVYTGKTASAVSDRDSGDTVCKIDFTGFNQRGEFYIRIKGKEWRSFPFTIGYDLYRKQGQDLLTDSLNYFYQSRAGSDIAAKFVTSGNTEELAHTGKKDDGVGVLQTGWYDDLLLTADDVETHGLGRIDTSGGWYTGLNFDKNMTEGGAALWTLQNMYEHYLTNQADSGIFADGSGTVVVPESGNRIPDILDECRYELDFMSKMKVQPDDKTWGEYAGLYYHRAQGAGFDPALPDYEHAYRAKYAVHPPTFAATLNYAACAAQGARLWQEYDPDYADDLLKSAKEAYQAYLKYYYEADRSATVHPLGFACPKEELNETSLYAPMLQAKTLLTDGDLDVTDEAYWAACELYISTYILDDDDSEMQFYLKELTGYRNAFQVRPRIYNDSDVAGEGTYTVFSNINMASAGSLSLSMHPYLLTNSQQEKLEDSLIQTADAYLKTESGQGYGIPYLYDGPGYNDPVNLSPSTILYGYEYGSNVYALNNMIAMAYAYDLTGDSKYINGVASGMDYLLGNNPLAYSFITGYGSYHAENPAHRYWRNEENHSLPKAPDGVLVSGPNAGLQDSYVCGLGLEQGDKKIPSQRCYADSVQSWSTNTATLTGNASLAWITAFLDAYGNDAIVPGDVNGDGSFNADDAELLQKWLLTKSGITLADWKAADYNNDQKITAADLSLMKKDYLRQNVYSKYIRPRNYEYRGTPITVLSDGLKLYRGPDEHLEVYTTIPRYATIRECGYNEEDEEWIFTQYNEIFGWIKTVADDGTTPTIEYMQAPAKPVIYLYPEKETDVHVELELTEAELATTYPKYHDGWDVTASPDGTLLNKADGSYHRYLFWDAVNCRTRFDFSKGFCVAGSDTEQFLKEKLTYMGLTEEEMNEFIVYWLPRMEHNPYNLISFQGDAYTNSAKLTVTPAPDSECRIFMAYIPLDAAEEIEPQPLEPFERIGFTVVEWGGVEIRS